jgi:hypothetical protein
VSALILAAKLVVVCANRGVDVVVAGLTFPLAPSDRLGEPDVPVRVGVVVALPDPVAFTGVSGLCGAFMAILSGVCMTDFSLV